MFGFKKEKMGELALNSNTSESQNIDISKEDVNNKILKTFNEEIIIGLCGPIGTDIHSVADQLKNIIEEKYDYTVKIIRLSDFIRTKYSIESEKNSIKKIEDVLKLIDKGNSYRKDSGSSILAELAIAEIAKSRERNLAIDETQLSSRCCYIIDSIKNTEELETFRIVYGDIFYFFGVYSNIENREKYLINKGIKKDSIQKLIDRDSGEEIKNGQKVGDTFIQADFFLRNDNQSAQSLKYKIERYLNLIFSSEIVTPTNDETAMYQAFAAAGNSACLSRQVGASITNKQGEVIAIGWNDVPKYGGGVYTANGNDLLSSNDKRCMNLVDGKCHNDYEKEIIRNLLLDELIEKNIVSEDKRNLAAEVIKKSRLKEIIEFSRAVHAEMHAIITASQKAGSQVVEGKLYCTTYPCHNCARHIVAAGIKQVFFIEPYRKSLALKLHDDSITESENGDNEKMQILMFDGVAPRRYLNFFKMAPNSRKENGRKKQENKKEIYPKNRITLQAVPLLEKLIIEDLKVKKEIDVNQE